MMKVNLRDMSHTEFMERLTDRTVILIPLGSLEVQGPHAPMGDYALAERLAELSADALVPHPNVHFHATLG